MSDDSLRTYLASPAAVIVDGSSDEFLKWLREQRTQTAGDTHWLIQTISPEPEEKSIKIEAIRAMKSELALSLHANEGRDIVLVPADALTTIAQQALLKVLEEPPKRIKFWLVTHHPASLLDTIVSRSLLLRLSGKKRVGESSDLVDLSIFEASKPDLALAAVQGFSNVGAGREKAIEFVQALLLQFRKERPTGAANQTVCLEALDWLNANAHVGLTLDNLMITLWKSSKKTIR